MCILVDTLHHYAGLNPKKFVRIAHPVAVVLGLGTSVLLFLVQMLHVAPQLLSEAVCKLYWVLAIFIMYNILGNMWACHRATSSVASLPEDRQFPAAEEKHLWQYCDLCEKLTPPRSWHCKLCDCCILKRDHHCIFTAGCIGHNNHRYFFWFTFYATLGTGLCLVSTFVLLVRNHGASLQLINFSTFLNTILFTITLFAWVAAVLMLAFQIHVVCLNTTYYHILDRTYDLGITKNCRNIMGKRGLWTFISPTIRSPLSQDGTQWKMKHSECFL
ncbi:hypothetical protein KR032_005799 [Drosophila birchii]|nr:hypothetical protein KR032_005799 [Drosophila birchii]